MKKTKSLRHFQNLGLPTPEADPFRWIEDQRVSDIRGLQVALLHTADKFRHVDTETPAEPFSALKGRVLDEGDYVFSVDFTFHCKDQAVMILEEIATAIGAGRTEGNEGPDNTWSLRVGRTITVIKGDEIWLRANFLAPSPGALRQWLMDYAAWVFNTDRNPKREPQAETADKRTATTYRFCCSLKESPREMRATLLNILGHLGSVTKLEAASDRANYGEWSYAKCVPAPARGKTPAPEFFMWGEDCRFETKSALIAALEQAAKEVVTANIDCTGGYGAFSAMGKLPSAGGYRFCANIQFGNKQFCGESMRRIAQEIGRGETEGVFGKHRWSVSIGGTEDFENSEPAPTEAPAESTAPEPAKSPEPVLTNAPSGENKRVETAEIQKGAS